MFLFRPRKLILVLVFLLVGCESTPSIHSMYEKGVDFGQFKTYKFLDTLEPSNQQYTTIIGKNLKDAISQELQLRGITPSDKPDLLVGFNVHTKEKIQSYDVPSTQPRYYGYRSRYGYSWGPVDYGTETRIQQYTEGTLNIDVVNAKQKQLIWEGVAIGRVKDKPSPDVEQKINEVVTNIFNEFPVSKAIKQP